MLTKDSNIHCNCLRWTKESSLDWHHTSSRLLDAMCAITSSPFKRCGQHLLAHLGFKHIVLCCFRDKYMRNQSHVISINTHWQIRTIDRGVEVPHEGAFCGEWDMYKSVCLC